MIYAFIKKHKWLVLLLLVLGMTLLYKLVIMSLVILCIPYLVMGLFGGGTGRGSWFKGRQSGKE